MPTSSESLVIVSSADSSFALALLAMVRSVCAQLASEQSVTFYVFDGGLTAEEKRRIEMALGNQNRVLSWLVPKEHSLLSLRTDQYLSRANHYRLLLAEYLPMHVERAIYLDADTVVCEDLIRLWTESLEDCVLGAVQDSGIPFVSSAGGLEQYRSLGLPERTPYFNAGVLLINLHRWREERVGEAIIAYLVAHKAHVRWYNQDGFNAVLAGRWKQLDSCWNQIVSPVGLYGNRVNTLPRSIRGIVHFATTAKPWQEDYQHPAQELFLRWVPEISARMHPFSKRVLGAAASVVFLCQLGVQLFPLSNFPMYSSFPAEATYYYFSDAQGKPVAGDTLGVDVVDLKQYIETRMELLWARNPNQSEEQRTRQASNEILLEFAHNKIPKQVLQQVGELQIWRVSLTAPEGNMQSEKAAIAQWRYGS